MHDRETTDSRDDANAASGSEAAVNVSAPGAELAALREARGRSIEDIAAALRLPKSIVEAIESDRLDRIAPIYRRGYVANYARELGVDPSPFLPDESAGELPALRGVLPPPAPSGRVDRLLRSATYLIATTLIVPPLVYFFVSGGTRLFDAPQTAAPSDPPVSAAEADGVGGRIARALSLDGATSREQDGPLSASALPLTSLRSAEPAQVEPEPPTAEPTAASTPLHTLDIELLEDSWVEITDGEGDRLEFDLLRAGATRHYEAMPPFQVLFGRASAVVVELDGKPVRFDGDEQGSVAEFTLAPIDEAPEGGSDGPT